MKSRIFAVVKHYLIRIILGILLILRYLIHYLVQTLKEIKEIKYPFKIHFNPNLEKNDLIDYLNGEDIYKNSSQMCLSYSQRLDVLPNGDICPCKKYPELTIGNLNHDSI